VLSLLSATRIRNYDFFWHLSNARWIVENGSIPHHDTFSFTFRGQPYLAVPWLADLFFYIGFLAGGFPGVMVLKSILSGIVVILLACVGRELGAPPSGAWMVLPFFAVVAQPRLAHVRPETLGFVLLAFLLWLVVRFWTRRDRAILLAPLVGYLWLQTHASAVLVVPVTAILLLCCLLLRQPRRDTLISTAAFFGSLAVLAALPAGRELVHVGTLHTWRVSPVSLSLTSEWSAPSIVDGELWIPALAVVAALAWALANLRRTLLPVLFAVLGAFMASSSNRHLGTGVLLCVPLLLAATAELQEKSLSRLRPSIRLASVLLFALGLPLAHLVAAPARDSRFSFGLDVDPTRFPLETSETLARLPSGRTMNDWHLGGYLIWRRIPEGVYCDGRGLLVYPDSWYREMVAATESSPALEAHADRWNIAYGLGAYELMFGSAMMQSHHWIPIHHGLASTLFVRRKHVESVRQAGILPLELLRAQPDAGWMARWYDPILANPAMLSELEREILAASATTPNAPVVLETLAYVAHARPDVYAQLVERLAGQVHP